jgi:hypothetical protein
VVRQRDWWGGGDQSRPDADATRSFPSSSAPAVAADGRQSPWRCHWHQCLPSVTKMPNTGPNRSPLPAARIEPARTRAENGRHHDDRRGTSGSAAAVQYDEVDKASWPYMITIESRSEDEAPVRAQAMQILEKVDAAGWG